MNYRITCNRTMSKIVIHSFIREGDRYSQRTGVTCTKTSRCNDGEDIRDRAGSQTYYGRSLEGTIVPPTYVDINGKRWRCGGSGTTYMFCGGAGKKF